MEVKDSDSDDSEDDSEETHIQKMSAAHKLGLAKVESVKEWLSHVLKPLDDGSVISLSKAGFGLRGITLSVSEALYIEQSAH